MISAHRYFGRGEEEDQELDIIDTLEFWEQVGPFVHTFKFSAHHLPDNDYDEENREFMLHCVLPHLSNIRTLEVTAFLFDVAYLSEGFINCPLDLLVIYRDPDMSLGVEVSHLLDFATRCKCKHIMIPHGKVEINTPMEEIKAKLQQVKQAE